MDEETTKRVIKITKSRASKDIPCTCNQPTEVENTRPITKDKSFIYRRRACPKCGHRFSTIEIPVAELATIMADVKMVQREYKSQADRWRNTAVTLALDLLKDELK